MKDRKVRAAFLIALLYFILMLRFYLVRYYVPDFRLYGEFAINGYKAKDGFSSLFIWISGLSRLMPGVIHVLCLAMLAGAVFHFLYFYIISFYDGIRNYVIIVLMTISCGCWYYFYGKVFYDFPFSVYTYSAGLCVFARAMIKRRKEKPWQKDWYLCCLLMGLTLSWKPYNIFMLAGFGLLVLTKDETRKLFFEAIQESKKLWKSAGMLLIGYLMGNYNLLISPKETMDGIKAYQAGCSFSAFLFQKNRVIWDHVGDLPFHISVYGILTIFIILFFFPIMAKRCRYILTALILCGCFYLYIVYFSPGYTWHGFPFGVFLITYMIFIMSEATKISKGTYMVLAAAVFVQAVLNFGVNIPTQLCWYKNTDEAVQVLEQKQNEIYQDVKAIIGQLGEHTFMIDQAVKRYRIMPFGTLSFQKMNLEQTYIAANNIAFVNPLEYSDYWSWMEIYKDPKYSQDPNSCEYFIYIIPDCFKRMGDVADIHCHDFREPYSAKTGDGYSIYVYHNQGEE